MYKNSVPSSRCTLTVSIAQVIGYCCLEMISVYCKHYTKQLITVYGQHAESLC